MCIHFIQPTHQNVSVEDGVSSTVNERIGSHTLQWETYHVCCWEIGWLRAQR